MLGNNITLYKFKSLANFEQVTEILLGERLYCPTPSQLNDPLEGVLGVTVPEDLIENEKDKFGQYARYWFEHDDLINRYRICSFSGDPESMLMWSYYSGGHAGICIEVDMSEYKHKIKKVNYVHDLSTVDKSSIEAMLTHKLATWEHEKEYRIIFEKEDGKKYIRAKFNKVLIGAGMDGKYIRPILELCAAAKLPVEIASFNTTGKFQNIRIRNPYDRNTEQSHAADADKLRR